MSVVGTTRVAVSQRVDTYPGRNEVRDALDQQVSAWLLQAGCSVYPVPNALGRDASGAAVADWMDAVDPALILLSGGNNVHEFPLRDATEKGLLNWAKVHKRPVLGLCRGMQMMGIVAGGAMVQVVEHVRTHHNLGAPWPGQVNSYHNFSFVEAPPGYEVLARSADGAIEAMRHECLPWEGWMWHPEREDFRPEDLWKLKAILSNDS